MVGTEKARPTRRPGSAGKLLRNGVAVGASSTLRAAANTLARRLDDVRAERDYTALERRTAARKAVDEFRAVCEAELRNVATARDRLHTAARRTDEALRNRLARVTSFELERIRRRADAMAKSATGFDAVRAVEVGDTEGILAAVLLSDGAHVHAAAAFAPAELGELVQARRWFGELRAAERARQGAAELLEAEEPFEAFDASRETLTMANDGADELVPTPAAFFGETPSDVPAWARQVAGLASSAPPRREHIIEPKADEQPAPNAPPQTEGGAE